MRFTPNTSTRSLVTGLILVALSFVSFDTAFAGTTELTPVADTYVNQGKATKSYGSSSEAAAKDQKNRDKEVLVKFDVSSLGEITSAKVKLYAKNKKGSNRSVTAYAINGSWNESVTWKNKPSMSTKSYGSVKVDSSGKYYEWDVTSLVKDWVAGNKTNHGITLVADGGNITFSTKESGSNKPMLVVSSGSTGGGESGEVAPSETGVSDAPLAPVNKRIVVVAQDGSGNYTSIQKAIDNSRPGDTIQVKDGVYVEALDFRQSGTREEPIALVNFPEHAPVIDPGNGQYPPYEGSKPKVELNAEWIIVEGFEIRYGWDGVKLFKGHNTVRNNWIHHNRYQGVLVSSVNDVLIEGNTIEYNGTDAGACYQPEWGGESPKHCHAIYLSDYFCNGMTNNTIRMNVLRNETGAGILMNGFGCETKITNTQIENNIIENNSWGMSLYHNAEDNNINNNTFISEEHLNPDVSHDFILIYKSKHNVFTNNIFYTTDPEVSGLRGYTAETDLNVFDYNVWNVKRDWWYWNGEGRNDFRSKYQSVSGDVNGLCCGHDPKFMDIENKDYHIAADSPARDRGINELCSNSDMDGDDRLSDPVCDAGADEVM